MKLSIIVPLKRLDKWDNLVENIADCTEDFQLIPVQGDVGLAAKLNHGMRGAKGEYLIFLHDDSEVTPGWTETLPGVNEVGTFCLGENNDTMDIWGGFVDPAGYCTDPTQNPDYSYWLCLHKEATKKIGPFDERFVNPYYQDVDMGLQVKKAGFKIKCLPGKIIHRNGEDSGIPDERQRGYLNRKWDISL